MDAECVETRAPSGEVIDGTDAERDRTEPMERAGDGRRVMQAEGDSAAVAENDTDDGVLFLEAQARLEAEQVGVPVAAAHRV